MSLYDYANRFWEWAEMNELSANGVCLLFAVVQCANRCGWPQELSIPLSKLTAMTHLSRSTLYRAREELAAAGLLRVREGSSARAPLYRLVELAPAWAVPAVADRDVPPAGEMDVAPAVEMDVAPAAADKDVAPAGEKDVAPAVEMDVAPAESRKESPAESRKESPAESPAESRSASRNVSQDTGLRRELIQNKKQSKTGTKTLSPPQRQGFEDFWALYPRKSGRREAEQVWAELEIAQELYPRILAAVRAQCAWEQWQREGGRFIPYPARWLAGRLWEDEGLAAPSPPPKPPSPKAAKYARVRNN